MALSKSNKFNINKIRRILFYFKTLSISEIHYFILSKFVNIKLSGYKKYLAYFNGKSGLEIGGPTDCFCSNKSLPIYSVIKNLDGVNFGNFTIWEGELSDGEVFRYNNKTKKGKQFVSDAVNLKKIQSKKYDFVISCNCLEHIANPIRAIKEWLRVIKDDGLLLIMLPNKKINFDHKRDITTFSHLMSDHKNKIVENDMTHLDEILKKHDLLLDPEAGSLAEFTDRAKNNFKNRALHQHVFDIKLLKKICHHLSLEILLENTTINDFYILVRKV